MVGKGRAVGVAACVALMCSCSPGDDPAGSLGASTAPPASSAQASFDPLSTDCEAGAPACVDATIAEMKARLDPLLQSCDHNSVFALTYLRTTEEFRSALDDSSFFADAPYMIREVALFASFYFDAYDAWKAGRSADVPRAWDIAFDAAESEAVTGIGDALLGISAHVNRDLPFVLERLGLVAPQGTSRETDHDRMNDVLARAIGPMMVDAATRLDPAIADRQVGGQTFDDSRALQFIVEWRDDAWANAERLVAAPSPAARAAVAAEIETEAASTALALVAATTYASAEDHAKRDDHCATNHG